MVDLDFAVDLSTPGARRLFEFWVHGRGATQIARWGTDGSFGRCTRRLTGKVRDPEGLCAEYHKAATGEWPAEKGIESSVGVPLAMAILRWRALLALVGQSTGDKRKILPGALTTRQLPLPLLWQRASVAGKHDGSVVVGLIDKIDITNSAVYGEGELFTPDPEVMPRLAQDINELRYLVEKKLGGPSIDIQLDDLTFEYRGSEAVITNGRIAAATLVQVPAFAETKGAFEIYENDVLVASFGVMRPFDFITLEQWEESKHPRDAEGKFKEKPGGGAPGALPSSPIGGTREPGGRVNNMIKRFGPENEFGFVIREEIASQRNPQDVARALSRLLGRDRFGYARSVNFGNSDTETAKEHAEGILRVMEIFDRSNLIGVDMYTARSGEYAHATWAGHIEFATGFSNRGKRSHYLDSLRMSALSNWHPKGGESPVTVAIHEAIHNVHQTILHQMGMDSDPAMNKRIMDRLVPPDDSTKFGLSGVSHYADKNIMELMAEACTDVMTNGDDAQPNSKRLFHALVEEYERFHDASIKVPKPRPESPQEATARKGKKALAALIDDRDPTILNSMSRKELIDVALKLKTPISPGSSDQQIKLELLRQEHGNRRKLLPPFEQFTRGINEYVDRLLVRSPATAENALDQRTWPLKDVARELGIPVKAKDPDDEVKQKILDRLSVMRGEKKAVQGKPGQEKPKTITRASLKAGDVLVWEPKGEDPVKGVVVVEGDKRKRISIEWESGRREVITSRSRLDGIRRATDEEVKSFKPSKPEPKPEVDEPRYFKKKAGNIFQWYYEHNGEVSGPHSSKAVARLSFENKQKGGKGFGLDETDLQKFQVDLQKRRDKLGSNAALARELGVSQTTVRNWLNGSRPRNLDVVSRKLKEALGPDAPVIDVDTVKVDSALQEIFENRNGAALRGIDTETLRLVAKDRGLKLRANASRDNVIRSLIANKSPNSPERFDHFMDLLHGVSRTEARKMIQKRTWTPLDVAIAVDAKGNLLEMNEGQLIKAILDETHGDRPNRLLGLTEPASSGALPDFLEVPSSAREFHRDINGVEDIADKVENQLGQATPKKINEGQQGGLKEQLTFPDGTKLFGKGFSGDNPSRVGIPEDVVTGEQLASKLGTTLGIPVPRVYRNSSMQVYTEWIEGKTAWQLSSEDLDRYERILKSNAMKRIGLLDALTGNMDRNDGNLIMDDSNKPHGIDHGLVWNHLNFFFDASDDTEKIHAISGHIPGPVNHYIHGAETPSSDRALKRLLPDNPLTPEDVQFVRAKLKELEADFDHVGKRDWWRYSNEVLDLLEPHAKGAKSIFSDSEGEIKHERKLFDDPGDAEEYHTDLSGMTDMVENLKLINDENVRRGRVLQGGMGGRQERVFFPDGSSMFVKDYGSTFNEDQEDSIRSIVDREQLAALVGQAIGAPVPRALRDRHGRVATDWVDGTPWGVAKENAKQADDWDMFDKLVFIENTHEGRLIGLLDALIGNKDRHDMNLIVGNDGRLHGIDHGLAWDRPEVFYEYDDPEERYFNAIASREGPSIVDYNGTSLLSPKDIDVIRNRLETIRPQFERLGRERWLQYSLDVLQDLALIMKEGAKSIFDPNWDEEDAENPMGSLD